MTHKFSLAITWAIRQHLRILFHLLKSLKIYGNFVKFTWCSQTHEQICAVHLQIEYGNNIEYDIAKLFTPTDTQLSCLLLRAFFIQNRTPPPIIVRNSRIIRFILFHFLFLYF